MTDSDFRYGRKYGCDFNDLLMAKQAHPGMGWPELLAEIDKAWGRQARKYPDDYDPFNLSAEMESAKVLASPKKLNHDRIVTEVDNAEILAGPGKAADGRGSRKGEPPSKPTETGDGLPIIKITPGGLATATTESEVALRSSGALVFQRGNTLVRPGYHEAIAPGERVTISAGLYELTRAGMLDELSQAAEYRVWSKRQKSWVRCDAPFNVAAALLDRAGLWSLQSISGVITTPTLRRDGSILSTPGFDQRTRLFYFEDPNFKLAKIAEKPSREDGLAALGEFQYLIANFPVVSEVDHAVALSALITPVVRGALSVAPLHAITASTAGTGKSFLVDVSAAIATGRPCPVMAAAGNPEETEKRLVAQLLAGVPILNVDNVNGKLGGDLLCQAIERPSVGIRPLGASRNVEIENRATLFATGNQIAVEGDMTRRTLICQLDAGMEQPELRTFDFDPIEQVLSDRGRYVAAALTIVRAYICADCPAPMPPLASFEDWSRLVRSSLMWLGCADPAISILAGRSSDPKLNDLRQVLLLWAEQLGVNEVARRDEANHEGFGQAPFKYPELRDAFLRIAGDKGMNSTRRLGNWLSGVAGKIADGLKIVRSERATRTGVASWVVARIS